MESKRLDVVVPSEYTTKDSAEPKTRFTRVGVAFPLKKEGKIGYSVLLDFPIAVTKLLLFESTPKEQ